MRGAIALPEANNIARWPRRFGSKSMKCCKANVSSSARKWNSSNAHFAITPAQNSLSAFPLGTDALLAVLMALEIGPGDAVITTPYSFFATAAGIARVGATPLFVDIEPETLNISPEAIRSFIEKNCRQVDGVLMTRDRQAVRLIIPVHLFGLCCEMDSIMDLAREHKLLVIEDAARQSAPNTPEAVE